MQAPERRKESAIRTDRPTTPGGLPSVREVLELDAVAAGRPEVFGEDDWLDAPVRWVHVSDSAGVARLLDGGELLLSTGSAWPAEPAELRAFIAELADAGLSCLVLELGTHYRYVPAVVLAAARERRLTLVALHREVKFVTLTEHVHRRIIADQSAALQAREEVRTRFTALALRGSPADFIVAQLAQTLEAPVVLESLAHDVIVADVPPSREEEVFTRWEVRSRIAHRGHTDADERLIVPVEARGIRWGYLVALPGPEHPAGRAAVLEQGAIALALGRLTDAEGDEWARVGRRALVDGLLAGRFTGHAGATSRVEASGLPIEGAQLLGVVASGVEVRADAPDAAARALGGRAVAGAVPGGAAGVAVLLSLPSRVRFDDDAARRFARALSPHAERMVVSVGAASVGLDGALASLQEAIDLSRSAGDRAGRGPQIRRVENRPLARFVTALRDDHRLLDHGERMLAPLIEYDLSRGGDLLDVLGAMLAHPGNRTAAASASHLSRSVFYQRIALIQELLAVDLDDGEVQAALHLALLVRRSVAR
ncbi:PucR family transcriptional regulator [Microbacterium telephonicum]|uniref:CdaR family transcriptional regulator n=1 Tax=Microbacterium telephonicum TaxID=1714841 RepID=A0A498CL22_9MICO|nr:PucR family transcriptional regulator [Microbacterium telephonicum]RLK52648.1 CdaR family transcriptional regulator [Microbacterium telephonicum]